MNGASLYRESLGCVSWNRTTHLNLFFFKRYWKWLKLAFYKQPKIRRMSSGNLQLKSLVFQQYFDQLEKGYLRYSYLKIIYFPLKSFIYSYCCFCCQTKVIYNFLLEIWYFPTVIGNIQTFQTWAKIQYIQSNWSWKKNKKIDLLIDL